MSDTDIVLSKMLAEPSILGVEDNNLSSADECLMGLDSINPALLDDVVDCDINSSMSTFITWAGLSSISSNENFLCKNTMLLTALEIRLQSVWNKCYVSGKLVDEIFVGWDRNTNGMDNIYWSSLTAADRARGVVNATYSSRIGKIFDKMIETSRISNEIDRLDRKLHLAQEFIIKKINDKNKKFQRMTSFILFFIAMFTMAPSFVNVPLIRDKGTGIILLFVIFVVGAFVVLRSS
ncbi:hypothetical protein ACSDBR_14540 [Acidithiobacillus ferriphilus]|uniref:hypothetical protein n=1 Tax=Acidithiobacillus ferriphilus TaxID=1689834 RepID=UPI003F5113A6